MVGGAPHGPWAVQYECRSCGEYVTTSEPAKEYDRRKRDNEGEQDDEA